ncbi:MAG: helix-turn-helix transcriptional regulator [Anaerolineae bacterium]|nr:helix-turn-helix transcriptional regulator [Anaerolineae bacterium]MBL6965934.1 helix-turn-helix transcriptional regulator [Anaerolineales bacterium]
MAVPLAIKIRAKKLGVLLRDARMAAGKTMKECAKVIGVSGHRIGTYERGENSPSLPELEGLAFYLNIPIRKFLDADALVSQQPLDTGGFQSAIAIRHRIIAARLRMARQETDQTLAELAEQLGVTSGAVRAYERGDRPIPLPDLEQLARIFSLDIDELRDQTGPAGNWSFEQETVQQFLALSSEIKAFIAKPVNTPYLELAMKLSEMSAEHMRAVAEGLLDITL